MKKIKLTKGKFATVDDADYPKLAIHKWHAIKGAHCFYAGRDGENKYKILMHREILGVERGVEVDHRDGDGLNNIRRNMRPATRGQNGANNRSWRGTSKYKGVFWDSQFSSWHAKITFEKKIVFLGRFKKESEASFAYDFAAMMLRGEFARTNHVHIP